MLLTFLKRTGILLELQKGQIVKQTFINAKLAARELIRTPGDLKHDADGETLVFIRIVNQLLQLEQMTFYANRSSMPQLAFNVLGKHRRRR